MFSNVFNDCNITNDSDNNEKCNFSSDSVIKKVYDSYKPLNFYEFLEDLDKNIVNTKYAKKQKLKLIENDFRTYANSILPILKTPGLVLLIVLSKYVYNIEALCKSDNKDEEKDRDTDIDTSMTNENMCVKNTSSDFIDLTKSSCNCTCSSVDSYKSSDEIKVLTGLNSLDNRREESFDLNYFNDFIIPQAFAFEKHIFEDTEVSEEVKARHKGEFKCISVNSLSSLSLYRKAVYYSLNNDFYSLKEPLFALDLLNLNFDNKCIEYGYDVLMKRHVCPRIYDLFTKLPILHSCIYEKDMFSYITNASSVVKITERYYFDILRKRIDLKVVESVYDIALKELMISEFENKESEGSLLVFTKSLDNLGISFHTGIKIVSMLFEEIDQANVKRRLEKKFKPIFELTSSVELVDKKRIRKLSEIKNLSSLEIDFVRFFTIVYLSLGSFKLKSVNSLASSNFPSLLTLDEDIEILNYQNSASKLNLGNQDEIFDLGNYALINKFKESQLITTKENFQFQAKMYSKIIEKLQSDAKFKNYNFKPLSSRTVVSIKGIEPMRVLLSISIVKRTLDQCSCMKEIRKDNVAENLILLALERLNDGNLMLVV
ncbi:MAG: hypothetical protein UHD07_08055 [Ruminobacter sp.]|nr:hypothetical protein [Ruminobacter sp.]